MPRIYAPNESHESKYEAEFIEGVTALDANHPLIEWFDERGYEIVDGINKITPFDRLSTERLIELCGYIGVNSDGLEKFEIVAAIEDALKAIYKITITTFDAIPNVSAGDLEEPVFANAAAVIAALPKVVYATFEDGVVAEVPVTTWVDTDTYSALAAGSYTFTATLGTVPTPFATSATITVEVVLSE